MGKSSNTSSAAAAAAAAKSSSCSSCKCSSKSCWLSCLKTTVLVSAAIALVLFLLYTQRTYVFEASKMQEIARTAIKAAGANATAGAVIERVIKGLYQAYPEHIQEHPEWLFNNAGGAMGAMLLLHASTSEYVIIFGTPVGTEGHTGRFFAEDYFTILTGEQWAFSAGELEKEVYRPGDQHYLGWQQAKQYRMPEGCWALEYARGSIISMMPFGLWDTLFSTLDFNTFAHTAQISGKFMLSEMLKGKF